MDAISYDVGDNVVRVGTFAEFICWDFYQSFTVTLDVVYHHSLYIYITHGFS